MLKLFSDNKKAARLLSAARAAKERKAWPEAASGFERYLAIRPNDASAWVQLGQVLKLRKDRDGAERALLRALSLKPDNPYAHHLLGEIERKRGRREHAVARFRRALELRPDAAHTRRALSALEPPKPPTPKQPPQAQKTPELDRLSDRLRQTEAASKRLEDQVGALRIVAQETARQRVALDALLARVSALEVRLAPIEAKANILGARSSALVDYFAEVEKHETSLAAVHRRLEALEVSART